MKDKYFNSRKLPAIRIDLIFMCFYKIILFTVVSVSNKLKTNKLEVNTK